MATRTRTLGGYTATVYSQTFTQKVKSTGVVNTPASLNYSRTNQLASGIYKTMTDVTTPNFGKLRAEGGIINSPMSSQVEYRDGKCSGGQVVFDSSAYLSTYSWTGDMLLQYFPFDKLLVDGADPALLSHMTTLASTSAWAGVEGPEVQGQVFLAELLKTLRMIRKPCQGLRDYISNSSK